MEKAAKYTHRSAYKEYREIAGKSALSFEEWVKIIPDIFWHINRAIIVDLYEWRLPFGGGFIRIAKTKNGYFTFYWDRSGDSCRLKKKRMWTFRECRGWRDKLIGERGLIHHYYALKNDPYKSNYDVPKVSRRPK